MMSSKYGYSRLALLSLIIALLSACGAPGQDYRHRFINDGTEDGYYGDDDGRSILDDSVAVLGVVASDSVLRDFRRNLFANNLEAQVRERQPTLRVLDYNRLHRHLKKQGIHDVLLNRYRLNAQLSDEDWQLLENAGLRVRYLLIARVEYDKAEKLKAVESRIRNNRGEVLNDRLKYTLKHQRTVQVSGKTYDLLNGGIVWSGTYTSTPYAKKEYIKYTGSSFTGSVANTISNSFVNGHGSRNHPAAPSSVNAIDETFRSIAEEMLGTTASL